MSKTEIAKAGPSAVVLRSMYEAMTKVSLASEVVMRSTISSVTRPGVPPVRTLMKEFGHDKMLDVITRVVIAADVALGGDGDSSRCQIAAASCMISNAHRSFSFLLLSIREGLANTANGKAYGRINAQVLNEWTSVQEGKILGIAQDEHEEKKAFWGVRGNYDGRLLDKMEEASTNKGEVMRSMAKEIQDLKKKLRNPDQ